jgi:hypothetical protein
MRLLQMKHIQELFWVNEKLLLKIVCMGIGAGTPLTYQLIYPLHTELNGILLELLHHHGISIFS